ncbi:MAG TPA: hypothetical protein VF549_21175 [Solirubrobacteraceae bacterium]|jgi:hypothetical protein
MEHDPEPLRLSLELHPCGAGLAGSLVDESGDAHVFAGWLGLLTLLEAARVRAEPIETAA